MSEVERFDLLPFRDVCEEGKNAVMHSNSGWLVKHEDYAALQSERDALAAENALIHSPPSLAAMMEALDIFFADEDVPERAMLAAHKVLLPKRLPATDAAIAEIKALGADACVKALVTSDDDDFCDAPNVCAMVAYSLRRGGAE